MKKALFWSLGFVALYNVFFFHIFPGIGLGVIALFVQLFFFFVRNKASKNLRLAIIASGISIVFSFLYAWRANEVVQTLDFIIAGFFSSVALYLYKAKQAFSLDTLSFLLLPFQNGVQSVKSIMHYFADTNRTVTSQQKSLMTSFFRGIVIAIPIIAILFFLLTQADPIFQQLSKEFFRSIQERTIVSGIIFLVCFSMGITVISQTVGKKEVFLKNSNTKIYESFIVVGSVLLLFSVFLAIQMKYLFLHVAETDLHKLGIAVTTYSEYVRKGFFELLIASIIASITIGVILRFLHTIKGVAKVFLQACLSLLTIETGLLLLSAGKRLFLYEQAHGLTRSRIFGIIVLLWLTGILLIFLMRILMKNLKQNYTFFSTLTVTLLAFLVINIFPIDSVIATKYRPTINNEVDYDYIMSLSPDASIAWKPFIQYVQKELVKFSTKKHITEDERRQVSTLQYSLFMLNGHIIYLTEKYEKNPTWQIYNSSEAQAYALIRQNKQVFSKVPTLLQTITELQSQPVSYQ